MRLTIIFGDEKRDFDLDADTLHGALQKCGVLFSLPCGGRGICKGCRAMVAVEGDEYKSVLVCRSAFDRDMTVMLPRSGVTVDWPDMGTLADASRDDDGDDRTEDGKSFGSADESDFGLAVDIGTTTLGLALCHGDDLGVAAFALYENPQRSYGADVISRIKAASNGNAAKMQDAVTGSIRSISREICTAGGAGRLSKMVIAGNTTMIHLLLGEDVSHMGEYPFDPGDISMRHIVFDDTDTYIMPGISAFVGGELAGGSSPRVLEDVKVKPRF